MPKKNTSLPKHNLKKGIKTNTDESKISKNIIWVAGIILFMIVVYSPVFNNRLTNFDDVVYITENPFIYDLSLQNIYKIFSTFYYGGYYPLTLLSFAVDQAISPENPSIFILVNFLLHLLNTFLVFILVIRIFKNRMVALFSSLLFGVHTLHVESVAWVSERKDVLYAFFFFLSLIFYLKYLDKQKQTNFIFAFILFLFSVLSKTMAVSLVLILPLFDWYYGRNLTSKKVIIEKIPFVLTGIVFGIIAIYSQRSIGAIAEENTFPLLHRIIFAAYGFVLYLVKLIYPFHLSAFYPFPVLPGESVPWIYWLFLIPFAGFLFLTYILLKKKKDYGFLLAFFILNIILVLQIIQINDFVMADRFVYVASAGIFILFALLFEEFRSTIKQNNNTLKILMIGYIALLSFLTYQRIDDWQNSRTLWEDVTRKYPGAYKAWDKLGLALADEEANYKDAIVALNKALEINPAFYQSYINRGNIKATIGDIKGAIEDFDKAIDLRPDYYSAYNNRGSTLAQSGKIEEAIIDFNKCIELNPDYSKAYCNRGLAYLNLKKLSEAMNDFNKCLEINPSYFPALNFRALVYVRNHRLNDALVDLDKCLKIKPDFAEALYNRGVIRLQLKLKASACDDLNKAAQLGHPKAENMVRVYCN